MVAENRNIQRHYGRINGQSLMSIIMNFCGAQMMYLDLILYRIIN